LPVYNLNPLQDPRWTELCRRHPRASVFHSTGWLQALRESYGYEPIVYTSSPPGEPLADGIVFCRTRSWLTGHKLVSLPFADHCEPLVTNAEKGEEILHSLHVALKEEKLKYVEIRPLTPDWFAVSELRRADVFCFHMLDLRPDLPTIFGGLQKSSIRRKIQRADREGLEYQAGRSELLLDKFYRMMVLTRRRHELPPQPIQWFRNLITFLGDALTIRVASHHGQPIASILTLQHDPTLVYKYGCSDARFHPLGGMPFLMWKAIQEAKSAGLEWLDLGRSDTYNGGLIQYKDRYGATRSELIYGRISAALPRKNSERHFTNIAQRAFGYLPDFLLTAAGRLLYRHLA
jgi:hypothetical protein